MTRLRGEARSTFRSLRHRNFRLFFVGQAISQTGTWMTTIAQVLLVLDLTDSGVALGLLTAFQFGPVLLLGAWAGAVVDRSDKLRMLKAFQVAAMVQSLVLGSLVLAGWASVPVIYAMATVQGLITAFDNPLRRSFVMEAVTEDDVANAVSLNTAMMVGSRIFGPALAGLMVLTVGYGWTFLLDSVSFVAVLAGLSRIRPEELRLGQISERAKGQVREGLRYLHSDRRLFVPIVMCAIVGTLAYNFQVTMPLLVTGPLDGSEGDFTILFSILSLGSVFGALWTARQKAVTPRQMVGSVLLFGLSMLLIAAAPRMAVAYPVSLLVGLGAVVFMTSINAGVQLLAAPEYRGRVIAIHAIVFIGSTPIGGPLVGWAAEVGGARLSILIGAASCLVAAVYGYRALLVPERREASTPALAEARIGAADVVTLAD
ncbi:MAG: MFS transporter [Acidimicrobiia bacterium]